MWPVTVSPTATSAEMVWPLFVNSITDTNSTSTWQSWVSSGTSTGTTVTHVWRTWAAEINTNSTTMTPTPPPAEGWSRVTEEAQAERRRRDEEWRQRDDAARRERAKADEKAMQLLVAILSDEQRRDLSEHGYFHVEAASGRRYRIEKGRSGNVYVVDKATGSWTEKLCIHQRESVPVPDTMVIQKLLIESAEEDFRRTANITFRHGGYDYGQGVLDAERLSRIIPFPERRQAA